MLTASPNIYTYVHTLSLDDARPSSNLSIYLYLAIPIASASKELSATILLSLVNNCLIDLDTPVSQYIGDQINWPIIKRDITMRMLLNHTSGLPFDSQIGRAHV